MAKIKPRLRLKIGHPVKVPADAVPEEIWNGKSKFGRVIHVYGHSHSMSHYGEYDYCVLFEEEISGSYSWSEVDPLTEEEMCACELLEV